jgi:hypothetical protein
MMMTKSNKTPTSPSRVVLPRFLEFGAHASAVGKSLLAAFACALYRQHAYEPVLIRIESRAVRRDGADILIDSEDFAQSSRLPGGVAGVLRPMFPALDRAAKNERVAVIMDWGGGLSDYRHQAFAATRFGERLSGMGIPGVSAIVTTSGADRMVQATENLRTSAIIAPQISRCLILNRRAGPFNFVSGSEQRATFEALQNVAEGVPIMKVDAVAGESWKMCDDSNLTMAEVIALDIPTLAARLREDEFIATACQTQVAAWWESTEAEMLRVLALRNGNNS